MHILCWGIYDTSKPRTRILREGLRIAGATVDECHGSVWEDVSDKSQVKGGRSRLRLLVRWVTRYPGLLWRFLRAARPDFVLVGYPGFIDVIILAPFARLRGVPIAWDMFMSVYDTVVLDRRLVSPGHPLARLLYWLEKFALRRADLVFLDTEAHARRIEKLYGLPAGRCRAVWVGAEVAQFRTTPPVARGTSGPGLLRVLFYGQFIPLHGIDTIISAARLLQAEPVEWVLIGRGQEAARIRRMLDEVPLPRLRWIEWVDYAALRSWIAEADLCLGIFGDSDKAASVIPNKVFQTVAAGRPLITRDSPAIRELVDNAAPCVYLVPPAQPQALATAIREHASHAARAELTPCHAALLERIDAPGDCTAVSRYSREPSERRR